MLTEKQVDEASKIHVEEIMDVIKSKLKSLGIEPTDEVLDSLIIMGDPLGIDHVFYGKQRIVSFHPISMKVDLTNGLKFKITREHF